MFDEKNAIKKLQHFKSNLIELYKTLANSKNKGVEIPSAESQELKRNILRKRENIKLLKIRLAEVKARVYDKKEDIGTIQESLRGEPVDFKTFVETYKAQNTKYSLGFCEPQGLATFKAMQQATADKKRQLEEDKAEKNKLKVEVYKLRSFHAKEAAEYLSISNIFPNFSVLDRFRVFYSESITSMVDASNPRKQDSFSHLEVFPTYEAYVGLRGSDFCESRPNK